eukprot:8204127-Alexandrium_andersonii.AAC.1
MTQCSLFPRWSRSASIASKLSLSACWTPAAADGGWRSSPTRAKGPSSATQPKGRQFLWAK